MGRESVELDELVASAAEGDRNAQNQLLTEFWGVIQAAVRNRLSEAAALAGREDIEQEAAIRLLKNLKHYRGGNGPSAFGAWVSAITTSALLDKVRADGAKKRGRRITQPFTTEPPAPVGPSMESNVLHHRELDEIGREVEAMNESLRQVLQLHTAGHSYAQIAALVGCTPEAARKRVARGLELLNEAIRPK